MAWTVVRIVIASLLDRCFEAPAGEANRRNDRQYCTYAFWQRERELDTPPTPSIFFSFSFLLLFLSFLFLTSFSLLSRPVFCGKDSASLTFGEYILVHLCPRLTISGRYGNYHMYMYIRRERLRMV